MSSNHRERGSAFAVLVASVSLSACAGDEPNGEAWETVASSTTSPADGSGSSGFVDDTSGELRGVSLNVTRAYFEAFSAAGSVVSTATDMLQWLKFQLNDGVTEAGLELLNRTEFEFTHLPAMQKRAPPPFERPDDPVTYKFGTHSVAWSEHTYRSVVLLSVYT